MQAIKHPRPEFPTAWAVRPAAPPWRHDPCSQLPTVSDIPDAHRQRFRSLPKAVSDGFRRLSDGFPTVSDGLAGKSQRAQHAVQSYLSHPPQTASFWLPVVLPKPQGEAAILRLWCFWWYWRYKAARLQGCRGFELCLYNEGLVPRAVKPPLNAGWVHPDCLPPARLPLPHVHTRPLISPPRCRTMDDQKDNRTREQLLEALRASEKAREAAEERARKAEAKVRRRREEQLREALPGALARALWETRMYHRSVLTGRCSVGSGLH